MVLSFCTVSSSLTTVAASGSCAVLSAAEEEEVEDGDSTDQSRVVLKYLEPMLRCAKGGGGGVKARSPLLVHETTNKDRRICAPDYF